MKNPNIWKIIKGLWWTNWKNIQNPNGTIMRIEPEFDRVGTYDSDDRISNVDSGLLVAPIPNRKTCHEIYQGTKILLDELLVGEILLFIHRANNHKELLYKVESALDDSELLKIYEYGLIGEK